MNLSELSTAELEYICKQVHLPEVRQYFQKNPRRFAEIRRGFRPEKLSDADTLSILVRHANKPFISDLLNHIVEEWMKEIAESIEAHEAEGEPHQLAVLRTIAESVFCHNCSLYFKLSNVDVDEDYIKLFEESMSLIQQIASAQKALETEKANAQAVASSKLDAANQEITRLTAEVARHSEESANAKQELSESEKVRKQQETDIASLSKRLLEAEQQASEMQSELDHYHHLEQFADVEYIDDEAGQFQHISVGEISHDYNGQAWIKRLADIIDGHIVLFAPDETRPYRFDNRDRLYWKNGPEQDGTVAIWNWKAEPRDTDSSKDYVTVEFNPNARIIQIVEINDCSTLSELVAFLSQKHEKRFVSQKILFTCSSGEIKEGLLCTVDDFDCNGNEVQLKNSVFMLPHYSIDSSETIILSGNLYCKNMNLGIPKSIFRVRAP